MKFSRKEASLIIKDNAFMILEKLQLKSSNIKIHLCQSKNKESKKSIYNKLKLPLQDCLGLCDSKPEGHNIYIFYDLHFSKSALVDTLIHECIHAKLAAINIRIRSMKKEERLVRSLTALVMWGNQNVF